jgi:NADH:ubiquinone oxidoreductase subunit 2 (subunit N)
MKRLMVPIAVLILIPAINRFAPSGVRSHLDRLLVVMKRLAVLIAVAILVAGVWVSPNGPVRGGFAVLMLFTVVGTAIRWLAGASTRLSSSGRNMSDMPHRRL